MDNITIKNTTQEGRDEEDVVIDPSRPHVHVSGKHRFFDLQFREAWKYRDLIWLLAKRSFTVSYKQTILGPAWLFLTPILTSLLQVFVFGMIAGISTDGVPRLMFYLFSNAAWMFFAAGVSECAGAFTNNAHILTKVYFPRIVMPFSIVLSAAMRYVFQVVPAVGFFIYYLVIGEMSISPGWLFLLPLPLMQLGLLGAGCGIIVSALTTKYRDLNVLIKFILSLLQYATPVVYPLSVLGGTIREIMLFNPATAPMELMRFCLWQKMTVTVPEIVISWAVTVLIFTIGVLMFNKVERVFADTV